MYFEAIVLSLVFVLLTCLCCLIAHRPFVPGSSTGCGGTLDMPWIMVTGLETVFSLSNLRETSVVF